MNQNNDVVKTAAEIAARVALETFEQEQKKVTASRHDRRLRNTKLLLQNYRVLRQHAKSAVYEAGQIMEENAIDILDLMWETPHAVVDSIRSSVTRTVIIMNHVDEMLKIYRALCDQSGRAEDQRRFRVIYRMYISEEVTTAEKIAEEEHIDPRTVYKDINAACEKLSALIFGIDGLKQARAI